jgi:uncharacterized RDD family membrane protein YckC
MIVAAIGAKALYLLFAWLIITIICQYLSERKGYGMRWGLATGMIMPPGVIVWFAIRAKPESDWVVTRTRFDLFVDRLGSYVVDYLILAVPALLVGLFAGPVGFSIVFFLAGIVYYTVMEGGPKGQTVGKMAVNLRVVDADSGQPGIGYGRALVRDLVRIVSALVLYLGYLWMLWDSESQTWHDKAAKAQVRPLFGEMPTTSLNPPNPADDLAPNTPAPA